VTTGQKNRITFDNLNWKKAACASSEELVCFAILLDYTIREQK